MKVTASRIGTLIKGGPKPAAERSASNQIYAQRVEKKAYELYEKRGCQQGCDWQDWFEAERIVEQEMISGK
ncbi:MAG: DUF2934 domain-containing protein [Candidatus Omnitrophica bacterium]|nr:DUF2934 domain-containing protein [Candidatus Omnitrophota bacterium]